MKRNEKEIWARSITPGPPSAQNPHRSELAGVVCSLTIIAAICSAYLIHEGAVTVCLDGDQAIKNIQRGYVRSYFADYDMLIQIHSILDRLPVTIIWKWVRGHQDDLIQFDQLEYEAQQNVWVDQAAKEFLHLHMNETVPSRTFTYQAERFWLVYEGNKFTQIKSADLYNKMASTDILDSWAKSAECERGMVDEWDWDAYGAAVIRATYAERRKLTKLSSGFAPVGYMMMKWQKQDHERCPCCDADSETVHHMVVCPAPKMKQQWKDALVDFKMNLEKCQTRPQIIQEVIRQLRAWRLAPDSSPLPTNSSISWQLDQCVAHQNQIGWRNFLFGRISPLWKQYQRTFLLEQDSKITPETWARRFIYYTWQLLFKLWDTRNDTKHNDDTIERRQANDQVDSQIKQQYLLGTADLSNEDSTLLELPLEDTLNLPFDYKTRLIGTLEAARANFAHHQQQHYASWQQIRQRMRDWLASNNDHTA